MILGRNLNGICFFNDYTVKQTCRSDCDPALGYHPLTMEFYFAVITPWFLLFNQLILLYRLYF